MGHFFFKGRFFPKEFSPKAVPPHFSAFIFEKICIFYQKVIIFNQNLTFLVKNWHFWKKTYMFGYFVFKGPFFSHKFSPKARLPVV